MSSSKPKSSSFLEGGSEGGPRRRSVHFDARPATTVVVMRHSSNDSPEEEEGLEEEEEGETVPDVAAASSSAAATQFGVRRKSAPASGIRMDPATVANYHSLELSGTLKALDPELRKSFTKLRCTNIEDPEMDLDVVKNKLVGRDELEIYRIKQLQRKTKCSSSLAHSIAMGGDISEPETEKELTMATAQELSVLVQRLEIVAARLESVQAGSGAAAEIRKELALLRSNPTAAISNLKKTIDVLEQSVGEGEAVSQANHSASVGAFDSILSGSFSSFLDLCNKIGGDVATQGKMVEQAFNAQRQYLVAAANSRQPGQSEVNILLKPTSDKIAEIQNFREANRRSQFFNHLSALSESIPALGWVTVFPAPAPFVKEMNDAGQFYTNRVLKDWKEKDKVHADWVRAWIVTLGELQAFVKQFHTTGLVWNPKGGNAMANKAAGGPPPPPPPPPAGFFDDVKAPNPENTARSALFAELNKGESVTQGLKKVTSDMQTHKNPELRAGSTIAASKPTVGPKPGAKLAPVAQEKHSKFELDGKKWVVEYFKSNPNIVVEKTETNQSVYIYKCEGSTVKVNGKCNNIIMDSCKKTAVVFDDVVSSIEFINCQSVQMQVLGRVPTISIDKTDGCQMYLSKESLNTSLITAKSSEMNVMIPTGDDFVEQPVPEQFKTTISGTKLNTTTSESV